MQDRYAGDVGDFGKFALLRALSPARRLGVCWYLTSGSGESNGDGRHLAYLEDRGRFRHIDATVFDALGAFRRSFEAGAAFRLVASLERLGLLPAETSFHRTLCPRAKRERARWSAEMVRAMETADLVFLDPDNGLECASLTNKSAACSELLALRRDGRALVLYHHQTRIRGAAAEFEHLMSRLKELGFRSVDAIRLRPYSSRFYFLLDGDAELTARLDAFSVRWGEDAVRFGGHAYAK